MKRLALILLMLLLPQASTRDSEILKQLPVRHVIMQINSGENNQDGRFDAIVLLRSQFWSLGNLYKHAHSQRLMSSTAIKGCEKSFCVVSGKIFRKSVGNNFAYVPPSPTTNSWLFPL